MESSIAQKALEQVAKKHNVSVSEVMYEIEKAYAVRKGNCLSENTAFAPDIVEGLSKVVLERLLS